MKTIIRGSIVFIIWSALCVYYYVNFTKETRDAIQPPLVQTSEEPAPVIKAEPLIKSPGSFTVYHDFNQNEFISDPQFDYFIQQVDSFEAQTGAIKIKVVGHTDDIGREDYNSELGLRRASVVRNYLVEKGFIEQDITIHSKGESNPVATNETEEGRINNRRTEIEVTN